MQKSSMHHVKVLFIYAFSIFILAGCGATNNSRSAPILVGPTYNETEASADENYNYDSDIFLDVAVPVFQPGFPVDKITGAVDYQALGELDIWPQLRRSEAKLFAIQTKYSLQETKAFGSVSNVPDANTSADLFVLGTINHSDSKNIDLSIMVVDSTGEIWGNKNFEHEVSSYFFRDAKNAGKNPYDPVFKKISKYVYDLMNDLSEKEKKQIKQTTLVRYAQYYSPQEFNQYIKASIKSKRGQKYYKFDLTGLPADENKMFKRVEALRNQDLLFVDNMQNQFEAFELDTQATYRKWQQDMLPELARVEAAKTERNTKAVIGVLAGITAAVLAKNSGSSAGEIASVVGGLASVWSLKDAYQANASLKVHKAVIDEMGQGLDIDLSPTVMEFENETVELQGTASEQYRQWKAHLREIYELEATPDLAL